MADYDAGEITERERKAAGNLTEIAKRNKQATIDQAKRGMANFDMANEQNAALRDKQNKEASRTSEGDRFKAYRDQLNANIGLLGSMGTAMNGSSIGNLMYMNRDRADADNTTYWDQLQENRDTNDNQYISSYNQNQVSKNDLAADTEKALADMEGDLAANLNNINPNLYAKPGTGDADLGSSGYYDANKVEANKAKVSGYVMPDSIQQRQTPNKVGKNDYFSRLINGFNGR